MKVTAKDNDIFLAENAEESKKIYGVDISEIDGADISWESIHKSGKDSPTKMRLSEILRDAGVKESHITTALLAIVVSKIFTHYSERAEEICRSVVKGCSDSEIKIFDSEIASFLNK